MIRYCLFILTVCLLSGGAAAQDLGQPEGPVLLSVLGKITKTNSGSSALFDRDMLSKVRGGTVTTSTPWVDGVAVYEGPRLLDLMKTLGAYGETVRLIALNDYAAELPLSDAQKYNVILAMSKNGKRLRVRDKGPLFLIYPFDDHPELQNEIYQIRSVWQIKSIVVE